MDAWAITMLALVGWLVAALAFRIRLKRRQESQIRRWAGDNGYAVLRVEYVRSILEGELLRYPLQPFVPFLVTGTWTVHLQDDQGGQFKGTVHFGPWWADLPGRELTFKRM